MDFLRGKNRIRLLLGLCCLLALCAAAAVWSVARTGAFLTAEGDWQTLAGDYRIGTIDYTVEVNDQLLLGRAGDGASVIPYDLAVPIPGGVKMYDESVTETLQTKEFNEGAALMRVRVVNHSENMVDVSAAFTLHQSPAPGASPIRVLPLPVTLDRDSAGTLDYRKYVLDALAPFSASKSAPATLEEMEAAYSAYMNAEGVKGTLTLDAGLIPGSATVPPADTEDGFIQDGGVYCYYKDVFLLIWSEYGSGEYDTPAGKESASPAPGAHRQGRFKAVFTVGQIE